MKIKSFIRKHSTSICFVLLFISFAFFLTLFFCRDSDYFWHIKAGESILEHGILTHDVFSWVLLGKKWMSHEWLFEVFLAFLKAFFGVYHPVIYVFCSLVLLFLILFFTNKKNYLRNIPFSLIWIIFFLIFVGFIQARPHLISFSLFAITIYLLYDLYRDESSKKIYFLPLITILWANVHGGSSNLPYLFCFIFLFCGLFQFRFSKIEAMRLSKKQLIRYFCIMILCMICTCFNPHGIDMFFYPYVNILNTTMLSNISEWQPTVLSNVSHYPYFILLVALIFSLLFSKKKIQWIDFVLLCVVAFLGLKSIRFWPYTYIVSTYFIFSYIPEMKIVRGTNICLIGLVFLFFCLFVTQKDMILTSIQKERYDSRFIQIIKEENPQRLFNMYDDGGELIYHDILVFIDGRADLYSNYNYEDYLSISNLEKNTSNLIEKYHFDYFLVHKSYPIYTYLKNNDRYIKIYSDEDIVFYKKKD